MSHYLQSPLLSVASLWNYFKYLGKELFTIDGFGDEAREKTLRVELIIISPARCDDDLWYDIYRFIHIYRSAQRHGIRILHLFIDKNDVRLYPFGIF